MQVLFLQSHSTRFGRKHPSSGVFKTSTVATGTCVIVAGKSSHQQFLLRLSTFFLHICPRDEYATKLTDSKVIGTKFLLQPLGYRLDSKEIYVRFPEGRECFFFCTRSSDSGAQLASLQVGLGGPFRGDTASCAKNIISLSSAFEVNNA